MNGDPATGSLALALFAALSLFGGLVLERALIAWRWPPYFTAGFPLTPVLVPIPHAPEGEGSTSSVEWKAEEGLVLFWASRARRAAPMLLHGAVRLVRQRGGSVGLHVRWCPPWSPLLAATWLAGLGLFRGEGHITLPIAAAMIGGVLFLYQQAARRAASELRWAFVQRDQEG